METKPEEFIHQSIKGERIACGKDINKVRFSCFCAAVTCPECLKWQNDLVEAVFKPLE